MKHSHTRFLAAALLCVIALPACSTMQPAARPIVVPNGGFENGTTGWTIAPNRGSTAVGSDLVASGRAALKVEGSTETNGTKVEGPTIACPALGRVELVFKAYGVHGKAAMLAVRQIDRAGKILPDKVAFVLDIYPEHWTTYRLEFDLNAETVALQPWILAYPRAPGERFEAWLDDIDFNRLPPAPKVEQLPPDKVIQVQINPSVVYQHIEGWGGNIYPAAIRHQKTDPTFFDRAFDELHTTHMRVRSSWHNLERVNDNDDPDTIDWDQIAKGDSGSVHEEFLLLQEMQRRNVKLIFAAWNIPNWIAGLPEGATQPNGSPLPEGADAELVESMVAWFLYARKNYDITYTAISLFNEPDQGTYFAIPRDRLARLTRQLKERLAEAAYPVHFYGPDASSNVSWSRTFLSSPDARDLVVSAAYHSYSHTVRNLRHYRDLAASFNLPVWVTEYNAHAPDKAAQTWTHAFRCAANMHDHLTQANASLMLYFAYASFPGHKSPLLSYLPETKTWSPQHAMLKHFHNEIPVGARRIKCPYRIGPVRCVAFLTSGEDQEMVLVLLNESDNTRTVRPVVTGLSNQVNHARQSNADAQFKELDADAFAHGTIALPPMSITSIRLGLH